MDIFQRVKSALTEKNADILIDENSEKHNEQPTGNQDIPPLGERGRVILNTYEAHRNTRRKMIELLTNLHASADERTTVFQYMDMEFGRYADITTANGTLVAREWARENTEFMSEHGISADMIESENFGTQLAGRLVMFSPANQLRVVGEISDRIRTLDSEASPATPAMR